MPPPLDDFFIAISPKRRPNERFAALDRFARVFLKIRVNVFVALFDYLNGGPESEVVKALGRKAVTFKRDSKTGALVEVDGRGRKRSPATRERIRLAAQRINEGCTQRKMAPELFPDLTKDQAYGRTRDFCHKHRFELIRVRLLLQPRPKSSRQARR
jgi:hypothetical protein